MASYAQGEWMVYQLLEGQESVYLPGVQISRGRGEEQRPSLLEEAQCGRPESLGELCYEHDP